MEIRKARRADLEAMMEIYNYEVLNGTATFDLEPKTIEERERWFAQHNIDNHPLYVAVQDGTVAGYVSLSSYREKEAFHSTVELSIYIHPDSRRQGIAGALMEYILEIARFDPSIHNVVSVITSGNEASRKLHDRYGFHFCGQVPEVGLKFGQTLGIDHYSLIV